MKSKILPLIASLAILVFATSQFSHAQQWSEEEQELLDHVIMDWNAWMEAIRKNNVEIWVKKSPQVEGAKWWWTEDGAPTGLEWVRRNFQSIRETDIDWVDIRPVSVLVHGDVGIVHFYGYWKASTDGGPVTTEAMRTEVYKKIGGKWHFFGGQATPASAKDADPYN